MKKNVLIKGILVLIIITLLTMGFTGCYPTPMPPTTGTVYIYVYVTYYYNIYMDYIWKLCYVSTWTYLIYNVPIGSHFFQAIDVDGTWWGYDYYTQYITAGNNYVYLYP